MPGSPEGSAAARHRRCGADRRDRAARGPVRALLRDAPQPRERHVPGGHPVGRRLRHDPRHRHRRHRPVGRRRDVPGRRVEVALVSVGVPWPLAVVVGLGVGVLLGSVNAVIVSRLKLPPFIATFGTLGIAAGLALYLADLVGRPILPPDFVSIGNDSILGRALPGHPGRRSSSSCSSRLARDDLGRAPARDRRQPGRGHASPVCLCGCSRVPMSSRV